MHIARARDEDFQAICALLQAQKLPLDGLSDHQALLLVLRSETGSVVGCAGLEYYADDALIRSVALDPAYQGLRLGRRLIEALEAQALHDGVRALYLLTHTARPFFQHLGYADIPRANIPEPVQASTEFCISACSGAVGMFKRLVSEARALTS